MKFTSLISSGIDSPIATYMLSKRGESFVFVHADNRPFTDNMETNNFIVIAKHLKKFVSGDLKAYIVPHGKVLSTYKKNCKDRYTCVFCKRMLVRYAEKFAEKEYADAIIMGDSLGQVASQTLQNIRVIEQACKLPILRPLIGLDKENVIKLAKKIGTYHLSILPSNGCSAVPTKPATSAKLDQILFEEKKIDVNGLVSNAIKNSKLVNI